MARWKVTVCPPRPKKEGHDWILRIRPSRDLDEPEKRWTSGTRDRAEAERLAKEMEDRLNAALQIDVDPTFGDVYEKHVAYREADPETAKNTARGLKNAVPALSSTQLWLMRASEIDQAVVASARDELLIGRKLRRSTVNLYLDLARGAWKWAKEKALVMLDWPHVRALKAPRTQKRPFRDEEVARVLEKIRERADGRWYPFFCLQADAGARINAICTLRGCDVHRTANEVVLTTKKKTLTVPVPPETMALLPEVAPHEFLFAAERGGPVRRETPYSVFAKALVEAGIPDPENLDTHSFRRRWVATARRIGVPLGDAMQVTGHSNVEIHMGYQANAADRDLHEAVRRVHVARKRAAPLPTPLPKRAILGRGSGAQPLVSAARSAGAQLLTS